jgi:hypothetical protein
MRRTLAWTVLLGALVAIAALYTRMAFATPASGFVGTTIAMGRFDEIDLFNHQLTLPAANPGLVRKNTTTGSVWLALQKTKGISDLYVQNNVWAPGGSTGWHSHPGYSLIIVTAGTVTAYDGDDRNCSPTLYTQGMGFVDPGGDHFHLLRNEGAVEARTVAVQLVPADAVRRIDAPSPGNCSF